MENKSASFVKETAFTLTAVIPVAFSMGICSGMGAFAGAVFACIAAFVSASVEQKRQMHVYISFLIITYAFNAFGAATASIAIVICGIMLMISAFAFSKIKPLPETPVIPAVMLAGALTVTVLFTTDYFGIGATGNTVREMIASYLSLGFHPNWRGVLYGTIVMVVTITFPRKFKKLSGIISAPFLALILTTALNLLLNPSDMISAIQETGVLSFAEYKTSLFLPAFNSSASAFNAAICGIALFLPCSYMILQNDGTDKSDYMLSGAANCVLGIGTCMALPCGIKKKSFASGITAAALTAIIFFALQDIIARIPVHSCAVVLIVGAWQSVKWSKLKKAFASPASIICFAALIICCLLFGIVYGILLAAVITALYALTVNKKFVKDF